MIIENDYILIDGFRLQRVDHDADNFVQNKTSLILCCGGLELL